MADRIDRQAFNYMTTEADATAVDFSGKKARLGMKDVHNALALAGTIPGFGNAADLLDATLYGFEGDKYGMGLSLLSAIPAYGLLAGGMRIKKAADVKPLSHFRKKTVMDRQADMVEQAQDVVRAYGEDPLDANLVSDITDSMTDAAVNLLDADKKFGQIMDMGVDFEDAMAVFTYYDTKTARAIKSTEEFAKMGLSEADVFGKEAVEKIANYLKRGEELVLEDALTGKYGYAKIFKE